MREKKFNFSMTVVLPLVNSMGSCVVSDKVSVEGLQIGYMYREHPNSDVDSGWRFFSGLEEQDYVDNPDNLMLFDINTIANHDPAIIDYLKSPFGSEYERMENNKFKRISN
jgi:hypothetical protein